MSKILVTIVGGKCQGGYHKIGDKYEIDSVTPHGMCLGAWGAVFPFVLVLDCDGEFSWEDVKTKAKIHCPDPKGITLQVEKVQDS